MKLTTIASILNGTLIYGRRVEDITHLADLEDAESGALVFLFDQKSF